MDTYDRRDFQWSDIAGVVTPFDWEKGFDIETVLNRKIASKDQNGSYSCGGQAWSYYMAVIEAIHDGSYEERSAKFIYSQTFVQGGGSAGRTNCDLLVKQGVCRESVLSSYENGKPPTEAFMTHLGDITDEARKDASLDKALAYAQVGTDMEAVALAIRENKGVVLGVSGTNNGTWMSAYPQPPRNGDYIWNHWLYAGKVKTMNGKRFIGVKNSWGDACGENGWQWLSEEYFKTIINNGSAIWSCWTITYNPNPNPVFKHLFTQDLRYRERNPEVKNLQIALQLDGCFPKGVPPTDYFGDITKAAALAFMKKYKVALPITIWFNKGEYVGPATRRQLNALFA